MYLGALPDNSSTNNTYINICTEMLPDIKFETSALNDYKMTLKLTRSMLPHICTASTPPIPKFNPFNSMASRV